MADCLFCRIIKREIPGSIVFEDDEMLAFNDINPQAPTHVLIIPKRHIESLNALTAADDGLIGALVRRAAAIAAARGLSGGYRTVFNTNRDAGQTVFHVHLHLPRRAKHGVASGLTAKWSSESATGNQE